MKLRISIFMLYLGSLGGIVAQDTAYAHKIMYDLCSKKMHGRGYYKKGEQKAAKYIANQMKKTGLMPIQGSYFQTFSTPSNTITKTSLHINNTRIEPGKAFLPACTNNTHKVSLKPIAWNENTVFISSSDLQKTTEHLQTLLACKPSLIIIDTCTRPKAIKNIQVLSLLDLSITKTAILLKTNDFNANISGEQWSINMYEVCYAYLPTHLQNPKQWKKLAAQTQAKVSQANLQNTLGFIPGKNKDSTILICAHYDHLGQMGKNICFYGANDNACGIAMLLDLAKHYSQNQPEYTMLFVAFGGEEAGLLGSHYYVNNPLLPLNQLKFVLNLDLVGTGQVGATVVNATVFAQQYALLDSANNVGHYLPVLNKRGKARNSDHHYFTEANIPSFFVYFQGTRTSYHDVFDTPQSLPLTHFERGRSLFIQFLNAL